MKRFFGFTWRFIVGLLQVLPIGLLGFLGMYFVINYLVDPKIDTIPMTNAAFAITAGLASVCFSYERAIRITEPEKNSVLIRCGERLLHSSILFLVASSLKYLGGQKYIFELLHKGWVTQIVYYSIPVSYLLCFTWSWYIGTNALLDLNRLLISRSRSSRKELVRSLIPPRHKPDETTSKDGRNI